jgi:hypothetical protein
MAVLGGFPLDAVSPLRRSASRPAVALAGGIRSGLASRARTGGTRSGLASRARTVGTRSGLSSRARTGGIRSGLASPARTGGIRSGLSSRARTGGIRSGLASPARTGGIRSGLASCVWTGGPPLRCGCSARPGAVPEFPFIVRTRVRSTGRFSATGMGSLTPLFSTRGRVLARSASWSTATRRRVLSEFRSTRRGSRTWRRPARRER